MLLISPFFTSADTLTDLKAQITSVKQQIQTLQSQLVSLQAQYKAACVAPQITSPSTSPFVVTVAAGQMISQNLSANQDVTWKMGGASWATTTANLFVITAPTKVGTYNLTLTAINTCNLRATTTVQVVVVKAIPGQATVSVATTPGAQTIPAGTAGLTVANIQFDATQSSEDIRFPSMALIYTDNMPVDPNSCAAYSGATQLTTGSHVVNVNNTAAAQTYTFTFDNALVIPKGQVTTISIKCNIPSNATGSFSWGLANNPSMLGTGMATMSTIVPTVVATPGPMMTIAQGGSLFVSSGTSPALALAAGGNTSVVLGVYTLYAANESVNLSKIGFILTSGAGQDLTNLQLVIGGVSYQTGSFVGSSSSAVFSTAGVTLPAGAQTQILLRGDISAIGTAQPGTAGDLIQVNVDTTKTNGVGVSSGSIITATGSTTVAGVRIFKSYPTLSSANVSCNNGNSCSGVAQVLKKVTLSASSAGPVGVYKVTFMLSTSSASVSSVKLYAYDQFGNPLPNQGVGGQVGLAQCPTGCVSTPTLSFTTGSSSPIEISAGSSASFILVGTVTPSMNATTWAVSTSLLGDSQYGGIGNAFTLPGNLIWSDNATTTAQPSDSDWTNSYGVPGLGYGGLVQAPTTGSYAISSPTFNLASALTGFQNALLTLLLQLGL
jgi:hypothetical protein